MTERQNWALAIVSSALAVLNLWLHSWFALVMAAVALSSFWRIWRLRRKNSDAV